MTARGMTFTVKYNPPKRTDSPSRRLVVKQQVGRRERGTAYAHLVDIAPELVGAGPAYMPRPTVHVPLLAFMAVLP